jgi:hypothetical protein
MITTTKGLMDETLLEKKEGSVDDDNEFTTWVEFYYHGELVHRSVHVTLKTMPAMFGEAALLGD